jgi:hypothetical protein
MPRILEAITLVDGHQLLVVQSIAPTNGRWRNKTRLTLVETDGTPYRTVSARNVIRRLDEYVVDSRHDGSRSGRWKAVAMLIARMREEALNYRPGELVMSDVPEVTAEMLADLARAPMAA